MWNEPSKDRLSKIPKFYTTANIPFPDKLIYLHFFIAGCDWYIAEYDGVDLFWGYAILNGDDVNAEWGYISFSELKAIKIEGWLEVDCETDESWKIRKAAEVKGIKTWPEAK